MGNKIYISRGKLLRWWDTRLYLHLIFTSGVFFIKIKNYHSTPRLKKHALYEFSYIKGSHHNTIVDIRELANNSNNFLININQESSENEETLLLGHNAWHSAL